MSLPLRNIAGLPEDFQILDSVNDLQDIDEDGVVVVEANLSELLTEYQEDQEDLGSMSLDIQAELNIFSFQLMAQAQEGSEPPFTKDQLLPSPTSTPPTSPPRKKSKAVEGAVAAPATQRPARSRRRRKCPKKKNNASASDPTALVGSSQSGKGARQARNEHRRQDPRVIGKRILAQINKCLNSQRVLRLPGYNIHQAAVSTTENHVRSQSVLVFDTSNHLLCVRGYQAPWIVDEMEGLDKLLQELVGDFPQKHPSLWKKYKANPRGNHISFLLGWHCQYTKHPTIPELHRLNLERATAFIQSKLVKRLT
ncbi:hypothetical protein OG21DRAFT_1526352 [Imleria badia]|nr:hypothetical protein OG21DRAFT_1526352 [Imleria badia]